MVKKKIVSSINKVNYNIYSILTCVDLCAITDYDIYKILSLTALITH